MIKSAFFFIFLLSFQTLSADYQWRIEHSNGSLFWLKEEPQITAANLHFSIKQQDITLPLLDIVSLKHFPSAKTHWLYQNPGEVPEKYKAASAVVRIKSKTHRGSGVMIHPSGYILTNHHLIAANHNIHVTTDNNQAYEATVFAISQLFDLAILKLKVDDNKTFHYARIGDDTALHQAETLFTYSTSLKTPWRKVEGSLQKDYEYFGAEDGIIYQQIHLSLEPDNSGSPLFNKKGELVGVLTKHLKSAQIKGGWFSIPSGFLKIFLQSINGFVHDPTDRPVEYLPFGE